MSSTLQHFLEQAAAQRLPDFEVWFPPCFDWARLCGDVPRMTERAGVALPPEEGDEHDLERMARALFKAGHLFTLAVLAAGSGAEADPDRLLAAVTRAPDEEEEEAFEALVGANLAEAEALLGGEGADRPHGEDVARAVALVAATWPAVEHLLQADPSRLLERAGPAAGVLAGLARLGALLAAFRWLAAEAVDEDWPRLGADA